MKRMKLNWRALVCSICLLFVTTFALSACGAKPNKDDLTLVSVTLTGIPTQYQVGETVDFSAAKLEFKYKSGTSVNYEMEQGEIGVAWDDRQATTKFVLDLGDLSRDVLTDADVGTYAITCDLGFDTYTVLTITVVQPVNYDYSQAYELLSFNADLVKNYEENRTNTKGGEGAIFTQSANGVYAVGDDNPFYLRPTVRLMPTNGSIQDATSPALFHVDLTVTDQNQQPVDSAKYTFDNETYGIQFTDGQCVGEVYTLTMTPHDFAADELVAAGVEAEIVLQVQVFDGWNAYDASDLARMNMVDLNQAISLQTCKNSAEEVWFNANTKQYEERHLYTVWNEYFQANGIENRPINGIFIHNNITVTENDLPQAYLISADEANARKTDGCDTSGAVGTIRDDVYLYTKYLPQASDTFTMNGNYWQIDFSQLQIQQTYFEDDELKFYNKGDEHHALNRSQAFAFIGQQFRDNYIGDYVANGGYADLAAAAAGNGLVTIDNLKLIGNAENFDKTDDARKMDGASTFCGLCATGKATLQVNNCLVSKFLDGFTGRYGSYNLIISNSKCFDCASTGIQLPGSSGNAVTNSVFKRFGGPCIITSSQDHDDVATPSGITIDADSVFESYVNGEETYFSIYNAQTLVTTFMAYNDGITTKGASIVKDVDGKKKINFVCLAMTTAFLGGTKVPTVTVNYGQHEMDTQALATAGAVVLGDGASAVVKYEDTAKHLGFATTNPAECTMLNGEAFQPDGLLSAQFPIPSTSCKIYAIFGLYPAA
ncbi:MAG: right-handed parallel beta-helix repeat-containing protein [Prevotella sp.]|nr:right-handed parallel beta-helix repeat-containing protein [Prevotella sp.]